jgi:hypothetical protein
MEFSFKGVDQARAAILAREFERSLVRAGVPASALKVVPISSEAMGLALLGVDVEIVLHALGGVGYIAVFGKCMYDLLGGHRATIVVRTKNGVVDIPPEDVDLEKIKAILSQLDESSPKT